MAKRRKGLISAKTGVGIASALLVLVALPMQSAQAATATWYDVPGSKTVLYQSGNSTMTLTSGTCTYQLKPTITAEPPPELDSFFGLAMGFAADPIWVDGKPRVLDTKFYLFGSKTAGADCRVSIDLNMYDWAATQKGGDHGNEFYTGSQVMDTHPEAGSDETSNFTVAFAAPLSNARDRDGLTFQSVELSVSDNAHPSIPEAMAARFYDTRMCVDQWGTPTNVPPATWYCGQYESSEPQSALPVDQSKLLKSNDVWASGATTPPVLQSHYQATVLNSHPDEFLRLADTATSAVDATGHGHNGTFSRPILPTVPVEGPAPVDSTNMTSLVSGNYVTFVGSPASTMRHGPASLETWFKVPTELGPDSSNTLLYGGSGSALNFGLSAFSGIGEPATITYSQGLTQMAGSVPSDNQWHYLVVTTDGHMYIDGALAATTNRLDSTQPSQLNQNIVIGQDADAIGLPGAGSFQWNAPIADTAFYPRVLTPAEVLAHWNASISQ